MKLVFHLEIFKIYCFIIELEKIAFQHQILLNREQLQNFWEVCIAIIIHLSMEMYYDYIMSNDYSLDTAFFRKCSEKEQNIKEANPSRYLNILELLFNFKYLNIKLRHKRFNYVKWIEVTNR